MYYFLGTNKVDLMTLRFKVEFDAVSTTSNGVVIVIAKRLFLGKGVERVELYCVLRRTILIIYHRNIFMAK